MKKRLLAIVLATLMLCTLLSFSILAVFDPENNETDDFPWEDGTPETPTPTYYTVTLPEGTGYTVVTEDETTVEEGGSFSFTVEIANGYVAGDDFAVTANDVVLEAIDGVYTIANIAEDQVVAVAGVVEDVPAYTPGDINGDAAVDVMDVTVLKQYLAHYDVEIH